MGNMSANMKRIPLKIVGRVGKGEDKAYIKVAGGYSVMSAKWEAAG
jgi:hypothetical protein